MRLISFFVSRFLTRELSSTLQEHRKACQSVQRIASRRVNEMANGAFDGTQIGGSEDRSGDPEAPHFGYLSHFRGLQSNTWEFEEQGGEEDERGVQGIHGLDFAFHDPQ